MTSFSVIELIQKKRDGKSWSEAEISWLLEGYVSERIPDYQMAAAAMAIFLQGMGQAELSTWNNSMLHSGEVLDLSGLTGPFADKHSTGGVGDKISIPLAPLVAECGVKVPMMSGRGLGHTGGTLDKLESIPGFRVALDPEEFKHVLVDCGLVLAGQSASLVPADRKLYALRDATGTVESIPLIASSICSKKLAEDLDGLVLDVKVGSGAFMKEVSSARDLAQTMVGICHDYGVAVTAFLTDMEQPLGVEVGNTNELVESIGVLSGGGPEDVVEEVLGLGSEMLVLTGVSSSAEEARHALEMCRQDGRALDRFMRVVEAQGGDPRVIAEPDRLGRAERVFEINADRSGFVARCDAYQIGVAGVRLGAGRERKEDTVDHGVGISVLAKIGSSVEPGQPLARIRYRDETSLQEALPYLNRAWEISPDSVQSRPLFLDRISTH